MMDRSLNGFEIKLLEENIGSKISDISLSNIFSDISPCSRVTKEEINKWDYIKLNSFFNGTPD